MRKPRQGGSNVQPLDGDGVTVPLPNGTTGYTLLAAHTYFFDVGGDTATWEHLHAQWDAVIVVTSAAIEESDFADVASISVNPGDWIKQDPATGYVAQVGGAVANSTVSTAGGAAGGASWNLPASGARRRRMKVVVGAAGGVFRVGTYGKD